MDKYNKGDDNHDRVNIGNREERYPISPGKIRMRVLE